MLSEQDMIFWMKNIREAASTGSYNNEPASIIAGGLLVLASSVSDLAKAVREKK